MSAGPFVAFTPPVRPRHAMAAMAMVSALSGPGAGMAASALDQATSRAVADFAQQTASRAADAHGRPVRLTVTVGTPDARLRLAPCARSELHALPGAAPWGDTRVGLRCVDGAVRWSIAVPVKVSAIGRAWVATSALPAGARITEGDLRDAEVDLAADRSPVVTDAVELVGRELQRPVEAGGVLRRSHLKARQWFAAGDTVRLVARGNGFRVDGSGQALNPGVEGQPSRVRTEGGRIVTVRPVGDREAEVML